MYSEKLGERAGLIIRRHVLEPGEATPWHTDACHRFTVVVRGDRLRLEYQDGTGRSFAVSPGQADWDPPGERVHRAVNVGATVFEEVVTFFLDSPASDPQPIHRP